jgi:Fe-S-cluster containining protein
MMNDAQKEVVFKPVSATFQFQCHRGLECFTCCCAALNLVLTPYDILRMKHHLKISSDEFLDTYTEMKFDKHHRFPLVSLKMNPDENARCPFVTSEGCTIYPDRPGACRIYPLGRAASRAHMNTGGQERFFIVEEKHYLGFRGPREWSLKEWLASEGVNEYNAMNDLWSEIITSAKDLGPAKGIQRKMQMFYLASYNLDKFRKFIFESRFFQLFQVAPEKRELLRTDDVELMKFALDWLKYSLFGEKTLQTLG